MNDQLRKVTVSENVIIRKVGEEAVLLDLKTNHYYSLNSVGLRMVQALSESGTIEKAFTTLAAEYEVAPEFLKADLKMLIEDLVKQGLATVV